MYNDIEIRLEDWNGWDSRMEKKLLKFLLIIAQIMKDVKEDEDLQNDVKHAGINN